MKTLILTTLFVTTVPMPAFAAGGMDGMAMPAPSSAKAAPSGSGLTNAVVKRVDASTGIVTLQHEALKNVNMPPMTMAFKVEDAAMARQVHVGDKVRVRIENLEGTMTIVRMEKSGTP